MAQAAIERVAKAAGTTFLPAMDARALINLSVSTFGELPMSSCLRALKSLWVASGHWFGRS